MGCRRPRRMAACITEPGLRPRPRAAGRRLAVRRRQQRGAPRGLRRGRLDVDDGLRPRPQGPRRGVATAAAHHLAPGELVDPGAEPPPAVPGTGPGQRATAGAGTAGGGDAEVGRCGGLEGRPRGVPDALPLRSPVLGGGRRRRAPPRRLRRGLPGGLGVKRRAGADVADERRCRAARLPDGGLRHAAGHALRQGPLPRRGVAGRGAGDLRRSLHHRHGTAHGWGAPRGAAGGGPTTGDLHEWRRR